MTNGQDQGQPYDPWQPREYDPAAHQRRLQGPPQEPPWQQSADLWQGYGQQYAPQGQPWQPQQYNPGAQQQWTPDQQDPQRPQPWEQPQYGQQQPGYGQPPWPPQQPGNQPGRPHRRKSWPAQHKVLTGLIAFGALIVIGGIASAAGSPSKPAAAPTTPATQAAAQPSSAPPASQAPASPAAVKPHTVAKFTGSGISNTPKFTVTNTWKLAYTYDCASAGGTGNFIVDEDGGNDFNGASVNELGAGKTASTWAYNDGGTHYLSINSECAWTVKVIDEGQ
jgi:hypothetical protein